MSDPDPHYTLLLSNHETRERLKIELFDLPFPGARSYDSHLPMLTLRASRLCRAASRGLHSRPRKRRVGAKASAGKQNDGGKTALRLAGEALDHLV